VIEYKAKDCVVIGSFQKYYDNIADFICLIEHKYKVLSPLRSKVVDSMQDFVILDTDILNATCEKEIQIAYIESKVLANIKKASFVYVYNPGGYIGTSTAFEIGFAMKENKNICAAYKPQDRLLRSYIRNIIPPEEFLEINLEKIFRDKSDYFSKLPLNLLRNHQDEIFTYIYNPHGHIDLSSALKIGYAIGANHDVCTMYKPSDIMLSKFTTYLGEDSMTLGLEDCTYGRHYRQLASC
jgi:hypothetical protein